VSTARAELRAADAVSVPVLAALHAASVEEPWPAADLARLLALPGSFGLLALDGAEPCGFALARVAAGEAEVLNIAVAPAQRRRGVGRLLLGGLAAGARQGGAAELFLEVAVDNVPARRLYAGAGFEPVGLRRGYYRRADGSRTDALVLRLSLN